MAMTMSRPYQNNRNKKTHTFTREPILSFTTMHTHLAHNTMTHICTWLKMRIKCKIDTPSRIWLTALRELLVGNSLSCVCVSACAPGPCYLHQSNFGHLVHIGVPFPLHFVFLYFWIYSLRLFFGLKCHFAYFSINLEVFPLRYGTLNQNNNNITTTLTHTNRDFQRTLCCACVNNQRHDCVAHTYKRLSMKKKQQQLGRKKRKLRTTSIK